MTLTTKDTLFNSSASSDSALSGGADDATDKATDNPRADRADEALVVAAQKGDRSAMEELLQKHYARIFSVCRRMLNSEEDACDAAQEAVLSIVRNLPKFSSEAAFPTWAYRIAVNACLDEISKRKRRPLLRLGRKDGERSDEQDKEAASDTAETAAARVDVQTALADLTDEFRVAVVLRDQGELSYAEIAELLDVPVGTVRSRIARGRAELAERLAENLAGEPNGGSESLKVNTSKKGTSKNRPTPNRPTSGHKSHE